MADALRGSMDAAEYKHVVLGLIFLKYISDAFEERHAVVLAECRGPAQDHRLSIGRGRLLGLFFSLTLSHHLVQHLVNNTAGEVP